MLVNAANAKVIAFTVSELLTEKPTGVKITPNLD